MLLPLNLAIKTIQYLPYNSFIKITNNNTNNRSFWLKLLNYNYSNNDDIDLLKTKYFIDLIDRYDYYRVRLLKEYKNKISSIWCNKIGIHMYLDNKNETDKLKYKYQQLLLAELHMIDYLAHFNCLNKIYYHYNINNIVIFYILNGNLINLTNTLGYQLLHPMTKLLSIKLEDIIFYNGAIVAFIPYKITTNTLNQIATTLSRGGNVVLARTYLNYLKDLNKK